MNMDNDYFKIGYLFGAIKCLEDEEFANLDFNEFIYILNREMKNLDIDYIRNNVFYELMNIYCGEVDEKIVNGVQYVILGEYNEEDYNCIYGITFIKNGKIELIESEDFKKLIDEFGEYDEDIHIFKTKLEDMIEDDE